MNEISDAIDYSSLRSNVSALGELLGETMAAAQGDDFLELIEKVRTLSRSAREGDASARDALLSLLRNLDNEQLVPVARAFGQFLNLANIADQHPELTQEMHAQLQAWEKEVMAKIPEKNPEWPAKCLRPLVPNNAHV